MSKVRNIVFDCNETILDLTTVTPVFERLFGSPSAMRLWFQELITYSQALTIADVYVPFTDIGGAVLEKIAAPRGIKITAADRQELTDRFATMPPYPDVPGGLRRLKAAGFHLFTLTDNTAAISGRQLTHGGIVDLFDRRFSVDDTAKRHKPAPEAYAGKPTRTAALSGQGYFLPISCDDLVRDGPEILSHVLRLGGSIQDVVVDPLN